MASGLRNLLVRIGADMSQMKSEMNKAKSTLSGFQSGIKGVVGKIAGTLATIGIGALVKDATSDAMKFEALMGTLSETLGSSINDFAKWQDSVGRSLGYSKLQSAELANTLSLNFKGIATSQADLLAKTTEMMKVAAVINSKRGMAMTEVSDRIRSAMNQEADGADELGVNVRASAIMQSDAYKQMANGTPWAQLSTNMQKTILYHHILQQVSQNLGIEVADNTAMRMNIFKAALLDVRLALGQAFLPMLNAALPYLTAFANSVTRALGAVASFMNALFGNKKKVKDATKTFQMQTATTNKQTTSVGKLGDQFTKTGKKVKKAVDTMKSTLAGFDALNILSFGILNTPDPGTGGSSGGGGGVIDPGSGNEGDPPDNESKWEEWANNVKKWLASLKPEWDNLKAGADKFWQGLVDIWNTPFIQGLVNDALDLAMTTFRVAIDLVADSLDILGDIFSIIADVLNGDWSKAWKNTKELVSDVYDLFADFLVNIAGDKWGKKLQEEFDIFKQTWSGITKSCEEFILGLFKMETWEKAWKQISTWDGGKWFKDNIFPKISTAFENIGGSTTALGEKIWNNIQFAFTTGKVGDITKWFSDNVLGKVTSAFSGTGIGSKIWDNIKGYFLAIDETKWFQGVRDNVSKAFGGDGIGWKIWDNIRSYFSKLDESKWFRDNVLKYVTGGFSGSGIGSNIWSNIKSGITKVGSKNITSWFSSNVASPIRKAFSSITSGLGGSITSGFKTVYNKAVGFINSMIDAVNKMVKKLNKIPGVSGIPTIGKIPKLAKGGITTGSTIANIGEAGREAVLPLENNTGWMDTLANKLASSMAGGRGGDIVVQVGGRDLGRIALGHINDLRRQSGRPILKI
ncbi:hypothetical protein [Bacillus sp. UNCCL81]|uniref:hypothetical protein n=1 Tax=Bacillus sp. UNCCL81 TaxID=1502755 RepID=UPI0008E59AF1|nr:hypothetical protein [Bacillus sp. UNCCL81]SFC52151.1 hypothetical protein SAMN02799633_01079 [Bacillus sp. UNCCL81]